LGRLKTTVWQHKPTSPKRSRYTLPRRQPAVGLSQVKASTFFEVSRKTSPRWTRGEALIPGAVAKLLRVMIDRKISPEEVDKLE
jgi:DNA-binding transcriptional regulator YiaG